VDDENVENKWKLNTPINAGALVALVALVAQNCKDAKSSGTGI
jgi:hypothetical protein